MQTLGYVLSQAHDSIGVFPFAAEVLYTIDLCRETELLLHLWHKGVTHVQTKFDY